MPQLLRIIIVEDNPFDADLLITVLRSGGFELEYVRVEKESALRAAIAQKHWDIVTSDHKMPCFSAPEVLAVVRELQPELPVIVVSGEIDIDLAVSLMKLGAYDYVQKRDMVSLPQAIERALRAAEIMRANEALSAELRMSEEKYRNLVDYSTDPIFTFDYNGTYLFVNEAYSRTFGIRAEDIIGRNMRDIFDPEDLNQRLESVREVFNSRKPRQIEVKVPRQDGSIHDYFTQLNPIYNHEGEVIAVSCVTRDISELKRAEYETKQSEERFKQLTDIFPEVIFEFDSDGNVTFTNPSGYRKFGLSQEDLDKGLNIFSLIAPHCVDAVIRRVQQIIAGEPGAYLEFTAQCKDGSQFEALAFSAPIKFNGFVSGLRGFVTDITERKLAEDNLRKLARQLHETSDYINKIIEYVNIPIIVWNQDLDITRLNQAFERLSGYQSDEVIGHSLEILFAPGNREQSLAEIRKTLEGEMWNSVEIAILRKDGTERISLWNSAQIYSDNGANQAQRWLMVQV